MRTDTDRRSWRTWGLWLGILAVLLVALVAARPHLDKAHVAMACLLAVLGGSAAGGRALGITMAVVAFFAFNFLFLPPFHTFAVANPLDWLVLLALLVTGTVGAELLYRAQAEAAEARARAAEVDRLATLGAETLNVARAEDALAAVTRVIRTQLAVDDCAVHTDLSGQPTMLDVAARATGAVRFADATTRLARHEGADGIAALMEHEAPVTAIFLPLRVHTRIVGVLALSRAGGITLAPAQRRFLDALAYYAALGVERARLTREAERAAALQEADRMKDALLASVSHDMRTPLTTIRARAHDIAAEGDERAVVIEEEAERLNRFVADLLDMSRLSAGGMPLHVELNVAEDLVGAALQRVSGLPGAGRIRATLLPGDPLLGGRFDFSHALRALSNLLENALTHAPADGEVELTVRREGTDLAFAVADRGPGVPPEEQGRIFEPFYRAAGARRDSGSAGLGLAIAHGLAAAQGGRVGYHARAGGGSVFVLHLPAADLDIFAKS